MSGLQMLRGTQLSTGKGAATETAITHVPEKLGPKTGIVIASGLQTTMLHSAAGTGPRCTSSHLIAAGIVVGLLQGQHVGGLTLHCPATIPKGKDSAEIGIQMLLPRQRMVTQRLAQSAAPRKVCTASFLASLLLPFTYTCMQRTQMLNAYSRRHGPIGLFGSKIKVHCPWSEYTHKQLEWLGNHPAIQDSMPKLFMPADCTSQPQIPKRHSVGSLLAPSHSHRPYLNTSKDDCLTPVHGRQDIQAKLTTSWAQRQASIFCTIVQKSSVLSRTCSTANCRQCLHHELQATYMQVTYHSVDVQTDALSPQVHLSACCCCCCCCCCCLSTGWHPPLVTS